MSTFSIKDIEQITGIKAHTLRIWEQRYKLMQPRRTDTNIRYYTDDDLRYILNISILNGKGIKISEIARMDSDEIREAVLAISQQESPHEAQIKALISSMFSLDEVAFNTLLASSILKLGLEATMTEVVFPFMHRIGVLWMTGTAHPAHEHFISNLIRQKLMVAIDGQTGKVKPGGKKFLLFLPEGESHEIGLLFANYLLRSRGHYMVYLGQNLPFEELSSVFDFYEPEYVLSAITSAFDGKSVQTFLDKLSSEWKKAQILVTGYMVLNNPELKIPDNVVVLKDPAHLYAYLEKINVFS